MRKQELLLFFGIIIFVAIIFFAYLIISLFSPSSPEPTASASPIPVSSSLGRPFDNFSSPSSSISTLPPPPTGEVTKEGLVNLLPIQVPEFDIEYLSGIDVFVINIKQNPYSENQNKAKHWFETQGFNPEALRIYWQTSPEVIVE